MIEPTDEMRDSFQRAYDAASATDGFNFREDAEIQLDAGLAAVLAIVERDYAVRFRADCLCGADLGPPWDTEPHRRGSRGCRNAEATS